MELAEILSIGDSTPPPARGRKAEPLIAVHVRDLDENDIKRLHEVKSGELQVSSSPLQKIRYTHHMLARLLAEGQKHVEISAATGYSQTYISNIQKDPAFKELISFYKEKVDIIFATAHERLTSVNMLALEELQDRLSDPEECEDIPTRDLLEIVKASSDRSGFGPQSRNVNVNVNYDMASKLESARRRAFGGEPLLAPPIGLEVARSLPDLQPTSEESQ